MSDIKIENLMKEYDLEIDDIRWYKSFITAQELLSYEENIDELVHLIWSGNLAGNIHDMEEKYLLELQDQLDRGLIDETGIREILADAYALENKRSWSS